MKLIDKDALVAEIERIDKSIGSDRFLSEYEQGCNQGKEDVCDALLYFLDTLEVKEVDLEKELNEYGLYYDYTSFDRKDMIDFAKHFVELGIKIKKGE